MVQDFTHPDDPEQGVRLQAYCDEWWDACESKENDAMGNDFGRSNFQTDIIEACEDWNRIVREAREKGTHKGVW